MQRVLAIFAGVVATVTAPAALAASDERVVFANIRILTMSEEGESIENGHVVVQSGEIVAVGEGAHTPKPDEVVVDGAGATIMPGLADMHVHYWDRDDGILYLANGITTVRNLTGGGGQYRLDQLALSGTIPGPRVYTSGPLIDGDKPIRPRGSVRVSNPDQAIGAVRSQDIAGFPAVKLYERLSAESYRAAVAEAKQAKMKVFTHTPIELTVGDVLDLQVDSLEHLDGYSDALVRDGFEPTQAFPWSEKWANADRAKFAPWAQRTAESGVWSVPTFALRWGMRYSTDPDSFFARPEMRFLSDGLKDGWRSSIDGWLKRFHPYNEAELQAKVEFVSELRKAGAPVLIGTDPPNPFVVPGFAIHDEFTGFSAAGYSNPEILQVATREAARFLDREDWSGEIAPGFVADLLVVKGDPRADLETIKTPLGVMVAGHWHDRSALDAALERRAAQVAAGEAEY